MKNLKQLNRVETKSKNLLRGAMLVLLAMFFYAGTVQAYSVPRSRDGDYAESNAIYYPLLFLNGTKNIKADPERAFALLKEIEALDIAKVYIAYCYELGKGVEKSPEKASETLAKVTDFNVLKNSVQYFVYTEKVFEFALKLADFYAEKSGETDVYISFLNSYEFKNNHNEKCEAIVKKLALEPEKNASTLISIYRQYGDFEQAISMLKYIKDFNKVSSLLNDIFLRVLSTGDAELVKEFLANKALLDFIEAKEAEKISANTVFLAFCKNYGLGLEKNEAQAKELLDKFVAANVYHSELESFARSSKFEGTSDFVFNLANRLKAQDNLKLYYVCLKNGIGIEKDEVAAFKLNIEIGKQDKNRINAYNISYEFRDISRQGKATKEIEEIIFDIIANNLNDCPNIALNIYCNLLLKGYGDESAKKDFLETLGSITKNAYEKTELIAYCYENGIGTEVDMQKAEEIRADIEAKIKEEVEPKNRFYTYRKIVDIYTSKKGASIDYLYSPTMLNYYTSKAKDFAFERDIANMSEQEQALMLEFREISKLFKDDNGRATTIREKRILAREKAKEFFAKVVDEKSPAIEKMADFSLNQNGTSNLDTLQLRLAAMPFITRAADDYCPRLYKLLSYAHNFGRGTRIDKKQAADYYLKMASCDVFSSSERESALISAFKNYSKIGDCESAKNTLDKMEEISGASRYLDMKKAEFYLRESPYKDVNYARVLIEKTKESSTFENGGYRDIVCSISEDFLELKELKFWAAKKYYEAKETSWDYIYRILISGYFTGVYCENNLEKALGLLKEYVEKSTLVDSFVVDKLSYLLRDVEYKNPALFKDTLESLLEFKPDSPALNLMKAIALDEEFGYEKDVQTRNLCIENAAKGDYTLWILMSRYKLLKPSRDLVEMLTKLSSHASNNALFYANVMLGNLEEAQKYGKAKNDKDTAIIYNLTDFAALFLKSESPEELAARFAKLGVRGSKLIYATMLYEGNGVPQDKDKAVEIFENLAESWSYENVGYNAMLWLWKHYTESNQEAKALALIDPKYQGVNLYYAPYLTSAALAFKDNMRLENIEATSNIAPNDAYAKYFIELIEDKYLPAYATKLIGIYGLNDDFKNLEKKKEIQAKARVILNTPKPTQKEEVNYPPLPNAINKFISTR